VHVLKITAFLVDLPIGNIELSEVNCHSNIIRKCNVIGYMKKGFKCLDNRFGNLFKL